MNVIAGGSGCCGLVYLGIEPFLFHQHLQYSIITEIKIITTVTGATIMEMNLTPLEDPEVFGTDWSFVKILLMLNIDASFILGILVAITFNLWSFRFEMFKDCIKLKISILE